MNLGSIIESGFKEIWAHWFRSLLTMFGIILGVASLVTMSAFVKGKENLLRDSLAESGGLERIIVDDNDDLPDYQKHLEDEANGMTLKDVYALQKNAPLVYHINRGTKPDPKKIALLNIDPQIYKKGSHYSGLNCLI